MASCRRTGSKTVTFSPATLLRLCGVTRLDHCWTFWAPLAGALGLLNGLPQVSAERSGTLLRIESDRPATTIVLEGRTLGVAPLETRIPDGRDLALIGREVGGAEVRCRVPARPTRPERRVRLEFVQNRCVELRIPAPRDTVSITVLSDVEGAKVLVDGRIVGRTPWTGKVNTGQRLLRVEAEGFPPQEERFPLEPAHEGAIFELYVMRVLAEAKAPPVPATKSKATQQAKLFPRGRGQVELATGFPFWGHVAAKGYLGKRTEMAGRVRSFVRWNEFSLALHYGKVHRHKPVKGIFMGVYGILQGGLAWGPPRTDPQSIDRATSHPINAVFGGGGLGLRLGKPVFMATLTLEAEGFSDRYGFAGDDANALVDDPNRRQRAFRLRHELRFDWRLHRHVVLFAGTEFVSISTDMRRRSYGDVYGLGIADIRFYPFLGMAVPF